MPRGRPGLWAAAVVAVVAAIVGLVVVLGRQGADRQRSPERPDEPPTAAEFADSIGVNIHLTYDTTPYGDFERVLASLRELGVRHVRDGLVPQRPDQYERLNRLAQAGIRCTLIMGAPNLTQVLDQVRTLKAALPRAVEAVEGPNEYDLSGDPNWANALRDYQRSLYEAVNDDAALRSTDVYAPTIVNPQSRELLKELRPALDVANIHPYPAGGPPEPVIRQEVATATQLSGTSSVVATETGYHNAIHGAQQHPPVTEEVAAAYLPRLFLSAFDEGIRRTYWYELIDVSPDETRSHADANFGLLRSDFSPKPAFSALANLMRLVGGTDGREVRGRRLEVSVSASGGQVRHLVLQKGDGEYVLALWREVQLFDVTARRTLDEPPVTARVRLPARAADIAVHRPSRSDGPMERLRETDSIAVPVDGHAVVIELSFAPRRS